MPRPFYLEPLDAHTNMALARYIDNDLPASTRKAEGGKCKRVWECSLAERDKIEASKDQLNLKYRVWKMVNGTLKRWYPPPSKLKKEVDHLIRVARSRTRSRMPQPAH